MAKGSGTTRIVGSRGQSTPNAPYTPKVGDTITYNSERFGGMINAYVVGIDDYGKLKLQLANGYGGGNDLTIDPKDFKVSKSDVKMERRYDTFPQKVLIAKGNYHFETKNEVIDIKNDGGMVYRSKGTVGHRSSERTWFISVTNKTTSEKEAKMFDNQKEYTQYFNQLKKKYK